MACERLLRAIKKACSHQLTSLKMESTKTQDSRQAVRVLGKIFMIKLYHSLVFIKSRIRLNGKVF